MKLLTSETLKRLPKIGETSETESSAVRVWVKFFLPEGRWTWYVTEYDQETEEAFGFVTGLEDELGYFSMAELRKLRTSYGLPIERDTSWDNATTLEQVMNGKVR